MTVLVNLFLRSVNREVIYNDIKHHMTMSNVVVNSTLDLASPLSSLFQS